MVKMSQKEKKKRLITPAKKTTGKKGEKIHNKKGKFKSD